MSTSGSASDENASNSDNSLLSVRSSPSLAVGVAPTFYGDFVDGIPPEYGRMKSQKGNGAQQEFLLDSNQLSKLFSSEKKGRRGAQKSKKVRNEEENFGKGKGKRQKKGSIRKSKPSFLGGDDFSKDYPSVSDCERKKCTASMVQIPDKNVLMDAGMELKSIAAQLSTAFNDLEVLRNEMEKRVEKTREKAVLPFQLRRARLERHAIREEISKTEQVINEVHLMSSQIEHVVQLQKSVKEKHLVDLQMEIEALKKEKKMHENAIREGTINRINLLRRYWPWRQLQELGDIYAAKTFIEEIQRGPRYRNVNIQNNIQSDLADHQLRWLENLVNREDVFRGHLSKLDALVDDLTDVTDLLESSLTCSVCGLLYENPVLFWPCGHTFCHVCFDSLKISPSLYRCLICSSLGSEGFLHNILVGDSVAKWMFKDSGFGDLKGPMINIRSHFSHFSRQSILQRMKELRQAIHTRDLTKIRGKNSTEDITVSYRTY